MSPPPATDDPATTEVASDTLRLTATFAFAEQTGAVSVRYRLENGGADPVAVFDRGDRHAVLTGRQTEGVVGEPIFVEDAPGEVSLYHAARALSQPTPTVPPTPLAAKLAGGDALEGTFVLAPPTEQPLRRVRWCLGVAPFDPAAFSAPETRDGVEVWRAGFEQAEQQTLLCTDWFDVEAGRFDAAEPVRAAH
ncbi:hypothetical protein [Luteimonas abyssi]|uniref:hypothetical protein n=1 Tax=Luteimonas abyssi TaxID=1247514 RepID=UPI000737C651|nr:hypothetical protein [Luteimonas abyssi]